MLRKLLFGAILICLSAACAHPGRTPSPPSWEPLSQSEQFALREDWLAQKHALLLPMMRKHGVGMWIVVHEEFSADPVTEFVAGPRPFAGNRDLFLFVDAQEAGLAAYAIPAYTEEHLLRFFQVPHAPGEKDWQQKAVAALVARHAPAKIALAIGGDRGAQRSLTHESYKFLVQALGPGAEERFVSAGPLIEEYLDTRLPAEFPHYQRLVQLTADLVARAFSSEVITPGTTTIGEVRRFLYDQVGRHGLSTWFQPDLRLQRAGTPNPLPRGFLAVAPAAMVIQPGDLLHVDFGLTYLGLNSDYQRMAYVLRQGETQPPPGLTAALRNTIALQDAVMSSARPGKSAAAVYEEAMAQMKARGIDAQIYSHPLGHHGHALGPSIDFRSTQQPASQPLRPGSYLAVELNTRTAVPEWNGQQVFMMEEDPAHLTGEGYRFFVQRQQALLLIGGD
ncbi:MAG: M24 family metallopeptidase [Myxococcota bacterium]|nr:M24 family metallopeptidase [Myxococcota bacterium]